MKSQAALAKYQHDQARGFESITDGPNNRSKFHQSLFEGILGEAVKAGVNSDGDMSAYLFRDDSKLLVITVQQDVGPDYTEAINAWRREDKEWYDVTMEDHDARTASHATPAPSPAK